MAAQTAEPTPAAQQGTPTEPPRTGDACRACNGEWGRHGLAELESCLCRTRDKGKRCRDGADCQGQCLLPDPPQLEVSDPGPPARGYFIGTCSEFVTTFGCNRVLDRGASKKGPQLLEQAPPMMCVD